MSYIDGFVAAVPQANKQAYATIPASRCRYSKTTALRMVENWGDDMRTTSHIVMTTLPPSIP